MNIPSGSSSPTFRIDVIFNSLRELRQEKERLQQYYNEEKARRKSLENKLEACQARFHQCSEKNIKMVETVNAARQKVLQTQNQANRLKELNDEKDVKINELRKQIEEGYKNEESELQTFEAHLEELTDNFRNAKNYYTQENLTKEMDNWRKQAEEATAEADREDNSLKEVTAKVHQLELETNDLKEKMKAKLEFDVTVQELQSALMVFEEMDKEAKEELDQIQKQLHQQQLKLEKAKEEYDSKRPAACTTEPLNSDGQETSQSDPMKEDSTERSSGSRDSHSQSVHPRPSEGYEQPSREDNCSYQFPKTHPGGSVHKTQGQPEQRRTSLQERSFFISLPFTSNN